MLHLNVFKASTKSYMPILLSPSLLFFFYLFLPFSFSSTGGGSNLFIPDTWPKVGKAISIKRNTPWSYMMNVCTHSYSLVW